MTTRTQIHDPLARGIDLEPENFPTLGTISPAHIYEFLPVLPDPGTPELAYVRVPKTSERLPYSGALHAWNSLWEAGALRQDFLREDSREEGWPSDLKWLFSEEQKGRNLMLVPYTSKRFAAYEPIYRLLPLKALRRYGIPAFKRGLWPTSSILGMAKEEVLPSDFNERLRMAFASLVWPHLGLRSPISGLARSNSIRILAHNLDFWLPYLHLVVQARAREFGRTEYEPEFARAQRRRHQRLKGKCRGEAFSVERPLCGGHLWQGEEESEEAVNQLIALADKNQRLREVLDAFRSNQVEEDFSERWSWAREDFERKLYSKRRKVRISFVQLDDTLPVHGPETEQHERTLWSDLLALLDPKERSIVVCLRSGFTQLEIASRLGYANHSAVSKALARIRRKAKSLLDT